MTIALVVLDVQTAFFFHFDPYSLTGIYVLFFVGVMFPEWCVQACIIM